MTDPTNDERRRGWVIVALAYLGAALVAWATVRWLPASMHPLWKAAIADGIATVFVFAWSVAHDNTSVYDPYWSVAPLLLAPWLALRPEAVDAVALRQLLVLTILFAWGLRLTFNWLRHWRGTSHEDWRYVDLRRSTGRAYWPVSLLGLHLMPTVMVFLGCLSLWPALVTGTAPLGGLDLLGAALGFGAVACEAVADRQLHRFRCSRPAPDAILDTGLWSWSRHPNYFGEIMLWWSLWLLGLSASPGTWWPLVGPVAITVLFTFISIPLIEARMRARRPRWPEHCRRVSVLFPRPPKGR